MAKSLFLGNLSRDATEEEVRQLFAEWGPVGEVRLLADKGFGFVDLPDDKAAAAIAAVNNKEFKGRTLRVDEARPKQERPSYGGGGGGGRGGYGGGNRGGGGGGRRQRY
jgi:RNA recognition motif-containing protein